MTETLLQTQIRLVLEQQCAAAFKQLLQDRVASSLGLTLIVFDYGDGGSVAFKTSLFRDELVDSFEKLLAGWRGEPVRIPVSSVNEADMRAYGREAERLLPAGVGFAILIGRRASTAYISSAHREGVAEIIETKLLPEWKSSLRGLEAHG